MSKELTEQWRNGTLESGMYYWKLPNNETFMATLYKMDEYKQTKDARQIVCLAPVLDYHDICELKQELETCKDKNVDLYAKLCNALMQLEEANKVIKKYAYPKSVYKSIIENQEVLEVIAYTEPKEGLEYLEKWGVK